MKHPCTRAASAALAAGLVLVAAPLPLAAAEPAAYQGLEDRIVEVAERVKPAVVHIEAIVRLDDRRRQVTGSGVIAARDGLILTNHHVVDDAEKVTVSVPGTRKEFPARIVGTDRQTDIAVLRIEGGGDLPTVEFGSADDLRVGEWVLAIGNPYGLDGTVSFGIVSAKGRNLELPETLNDFIQTDAMIDRGSSGGPLVDLDGRVVGINSRGQGRGIGFTIPIDTALQVAHDLEEGGIERGYLGVTLQALDRELADYFGAPDLTGAVVNSVIEGSPAAQAGLRTGDIITAFDGHAIETEKDEDLGSFQRLVASVEPGHKTVVDLVRGGKPVEVAVEIGPQPKVEPDQAESDVGFHVQEITKNLARAHRLASDRGAFVHFVARGSPAAEAGVLPGDVIERIEDEEVGDLDDFRRALDHVSGKDRFLLTARRGDETKFLLVRRGARDVAPPERGAGDAGEASDVR
jgi:serine protease Do